MKLKGSFDIELTIFSFYFYFDCLFVFKCKSHWSCGIRSLSFKHIQHLIVNVQCLANKSFQDHSIFTVNPI